MSSAKKQNVQIQSPNLNFKHLLSVFSNIQFRRTCSYGLICILTLLLAVVGYYPPALTQGAPGSFICDRTLYISQGQATGDTRTTLSSLITTPNFALNTVGSADQEQYNAIGLNVRDGFIYGIAPTNPAIIYRIDSTGKATPIVNQQTPPTNFPPIPNNSFAFAGDINRNGIYFVYVTNIAAPANNLFGIDLANNNVVSSLRVQRADGTSPDLSDIAFNPVDDQLYAFDSFRDRGQTPGQMARIDTTTGAVTYFGATQPNVAIVGASFFDAFGNFYVYDSNGNILVTRKVSTANPVAFQVQGTAATVSRFDGASCAYAPIAEKVVNPPSIPANGIVTYTYSIANQLGQPLSTANLTFSDQLPAGLTYVDQTLNRDAVGGTPNAYGGTPVLQIAGITIPPRGAVTISVNVRVSPTTTPGQVLNQATVSNVPSVAGLNLPPTIKTDYPPTGIYPDPTPLVVPPLPSIGLAKRVVSTVNLGGGKFQVTYELVVTNTGNVNLDNVQVIEKLDDPNIPNNIGTIPFTVNSVTSPNSPNGNFTPNTTYTGRGDPPNTNLLAGSNTLESGKSKTIQLVLTVTPGANPGPYNNQAQATGQSGSTIVNAQSNNNVPTPLNFNQKPLLGVAKEVVSIVPADGEKLTVTYRIRTRNYGDVALTNLQLTENLATTFGAIPFTVNRVSPSAQDTPPLTPNPNYDGRNNTNLLAGIDPLAIGETKTLDLVVTITPGNTRRTYENQVDGIADSPSGPVQDKSQAGITPDPDNDGNPTNNNDVTPLPIGPNLRLVKRITNATRGGVAVSGVNFASFVNDPNDVNDDAAGWSQLPGGILSGVYRIGSDNPLQTGDEVEYTVYFLSDGSQPVTDAKVCDPIPEKTTFIPDSFQAGQGILLNQQATNTSLTNAADTDNGTFFPRLTPVTSPCPNTNNSNGSILVNLGNLPPSSPNNVGFTRFRVRID